MAKQSVARKLPVYMQDSAGAPITGLVFGDISVKYAKEGDSDLTTKTILASPVEWFEIGQGLYKILFRTGELDTIGFFIYLVNGTGALQYPGLVDITENSIDDVNDNVETNGTKIDDIDTSAESEARFTEIKGAGWTDENLKIIHDIVFAFKTENFNISVGSP